MIIKFPKKTAQQIVKQCKNDTGIGKLLYNVDWYKNEDFYTKEPCRARTMEVSDKIEHFGKTWNECKKLEKDGNEMMNFAEMIYFILVYCKKNKKYPDYEWSWTSSRSSYGCLVGVGGCGSGGVNVGIDRPDGSRSGLGVRFFRSNSLKPKSVQDEKVSLALGYLDAAQESIDKAKKILTK